MANCRDQVRIIQGGIKTFAVRLRSQSTRDPLDLTGVTEIEVCFQNSDGSELMLSKTDDEISVEGDPKIGKIQVELTAEQTALLLPVDNETLEVSVNLGDGPLKCQIPNAYSVIQSEC